MRPIADAVTEVQVQTGSTSAEYGSYLGVHINVVTKSGTNALHGSRLRLLRGRRRSTRAATSRTRRTRRTRGNRKQFGAELDGPVVIPGLYDGRNKTFFMVAYEGVRAEAISSPFASVPTALMRQGNFSEVTHADQEPRHRAAVPGQHHPAVDAFADVARAAPVLPEREPAGHRQQPPGARAPTTDNIDQFLGRVDQNIGNKVRLYLRYNWHESYSTNPSTRRFRSRRSRSRASTRTGCSATPTR